MVLIDFMCVMSDTITEMKTIINMHIVYKSYFIM